MNFVLSSRLAGIRRHPLAACLASVFALSAPVRAIADTWTVDSCDEGSSGNLGTKTGTLRFALANALSPAVIDMTGLQGAGACPSSTITLTTGALGFSQDAVTIEGPGASNLRIDASMLAGGITFNDRVFTHYGNTKLTIQDLGVTGGHVFHLTVPAYGGCISSASSIELDNVLVQNCYAKNGGTSTALGGDVYAASTLTLSNSKIYSGTADASSSSGVALGGGVYAKGDVTISDNTILSGNTASAGTATAAGGAVYAGGTLTLTSVLAVYNSAASPGGKALGGALAAKGNVTISGGSVGKNNATSTNYRAFGGGVHTLGQLGLTKTMLKYNTVDAEFVSIGGGAHALGGISVAYSTVDHNEAKGNLGRIGGLYTQGDATIASSTISNNTSSENVGGLGLYSGTPATQTLTIINSTISSNSAGFVIGGVYANARTVNIYNSTIAYNSAASGGLSPGVALGVQASEAITLQSSILASNTYGSNENDLSTKPSNPVILGSNNIVRASTASVPVQWQFFCPLLGPLRDNGGLTQTHALHNGSPAIDAGNDFAAGLGNYDQRGKAIINGTLDYFRVSSPPGNPPKADMGAYEIQWDDVIYSAGFDGCIPLH